MHAFPTLFLLVLASAAHAADPAGWRHDGSGRFPGSAPAMTGDWVEAPAWSTPLPSWSNASPVVAGGRVFVLSEPTDLVCLDARSGAVLWTRPHAYLDVLEGERRAKALDDLENAAPLTAEYERRRAEKWALENEWRSQPNPVRPVEELKRLTDAMAEVEAALEPYQEWMMPVTHSDAGGYASPTPVSDGRHVWAVFGHGVISCHDMEGGRVWARFVEKPANEGQVGHSSSPLLVGGLLIAQLDDTLALDAATGETIWRREGLKTRWGSPIAVAVGDDHLVITPAGDFVRASDGALLASVDSGVQHASPVAHDGVAYFIQSQGTAVRLPSEAAPFEPEILWQTELGKGGCFASPLLADGRIHVIYGRILWILDATSGEVLDRARLEDAGGEIFASPAMADGRVFVASEDGSAYVFEPGEGMTIETFALGDSMRASPAFADGAMFLRTSKSLRRYGAAPEGNAPRPGERRE